MAVFEQSHDPDGHVVLRVTGDVDFAVAGTFEEQARSGLGSALRGLVLDLGGLTFIDSNGLAVLLVLHKEADLAGKELVLQSVPAATRRVLDLTGLGGTFAVRSAPDPG